LENDCNHSSIFPDILDLANNFDKKYKPGPINLLQKDHYKAFSLVFDLDLFIKIAELSDKYITNEAFKDKNTTQAKYFLDNVKEIDHNSIKAYLAIVLLMGIKKYPDQMMHWPLDKTFLDLKIRKIMPSIMYYVIKTSFHLCDNSKIDKNDPFFKINDFVKHLNSKFCTIYTPEQNISLDFRGRVGFACYIPSKPTKFDIKAHSICESKSGYCYRIKLDGGAKEKKAPNYTTCKGIACRFK